jgi:hypothetical protein
MEFQPFKPAEPSYNQGAENPTEVRYGWCPFKDIYLYNGDGTPNYFIQPVNSPYHRSLPKGHLIPFETFTKTRREPNPNVTGTPGNPAPMISYTETKTAHEAATELLRGYSDRGYVVLDSLQGLDQETAWRIFRVVHPFNYRLSEIVSELTFGAPERIVASDAIDLGDGYVIESLHNDQERAIARRLVNELLDGANRAIVFATEILNDTETSMTARFSGGKGKTGPDSLDQYIAGELDRKLPVLIGKPDETKALSEKIDFLVGREIDREKDEEIDRLRAQLAAMQATNPNAHVAFNGAEPTTEPVFLCGAVKSDGSDCQMQVPGPGERCRYHPQGT